MCNSDKCFLDRVGIPNRTFCNPFVCVFFLFSLLALAACIFSFTCSSDTGIECDPKDPNLCKTYYYKECHVFNGMTGLIFGSFSGIAFLILCCCYFACYVQPPPSATYVRII